MSDRYDVGAEDIDYEAQGWHVVGEGRFVLDPDPTPDWLECRARAEMERAEARRVACLTASALEGGMRGEGVEYLRSFDVATEMWIRTRTEELAKERKGE